MVWEIQVRWWRRLSERELEEPFVCKDVGCAPTVNCVPSFALELCPSKDAPVFTVTVALSFSSFSLSTRTYPSSTASASSITPLLTCPSLLLCYPMRLCNSLIATLAMTSVGAHAYCIW